MSISRAERRRRNKIIQREKKKAERRRERKNASQQDIPTIRVGNVLYTLSDRIHAISAGGIPVIHELVEKIGLVGFLNELGLIKRNLPYHESDHILTVVYNLFAGGVCLEDVERLRTNETYLKALGAERLPDPTTLGDFMRRFTEEDVVLLMDLVNQARQVVWREQDSDFFEEATIEGDGVVCPTLGNCSEGIGMSYKGTIGYHPLVISLAETKEPLYIVNRPGNANSCRGATEWFDAAITLVRSAGFRKVTLRGDTAFSQTSELDRWTEDDVRVLFGFRMSPELLDKAHSLTVRDWSLLERPEQYEIATTERAKQHDYRQELVNENGYVNLKLQSEYVAEIRHRPSEAKNEYRVIFVYKDITKQQGQLPLLHEDRYLAYITNDWDTPASELVFQANQRCDQENVIEQLRNGVHAFRNPVKTLVGNWAYSVITSIALSLATWFSLLLPAKGKWKTEHTQEKHEAQRMEFKRFINSFIHIPAQIIESARRIEVRLLGWNEHVPALLRMTDWLACPLRC